ncbi:hypothetical protein CL616_05030 [archaeon]|nr:hypothetical protein [archaeon]
MVSEGFDFNAFMGTLDSIGFYTVALPFLLIFTIVFAMLEKIKLFGPQSRKFNMLIALVMAFLVIRVQSLVETINTFLPQVSFLALIFIVFLLLLGILIGPTEGGWKGIPLFLGVVVTIGVIIYALMSSSGAIATGLPSWLKLTTQDRNILIGIVLFFMFIWFVVSEPGEQSPWKKFGDYLGKLPEEFGK